MLFNSTFYGATSVQDIEAFQVDKLELLLANTEYSYVFPLGTKTVGFRNRNEGVLKLRHTSGGEYATHEANFWWYIAGIKPDATITLILESPKPSQHVELLFWS